MCGKCELFCAHVMNYDARMVGLRPSGYACELCALKKEGIFPGDINRELMDWLPSS